MGLSNATTQKNASHAAALRRVRRVVLVDLRLHARAVFQVAQRVPDLAREDRQRNAVRLLARQDELGPPREERVLLHGAASWVSSVHQSAPPP